MEYIMEHLGLVGGSRPSSSPCSFGARFSGFFGVIIVPDDSLGTVTRNSCYFGSNRNLPDGTIIALNGEAGFQADTLPPGLHIDFGLGNTRSNSSSSSPFRRAASVSYRRATEFPSATGGSLLPMWSAISSRMRVQFCLATASAVRR